MRSSPSPACTHTARTRPAIQEGKRLAQRALTIAPGNVTALNMVALADLRTGNAKVAGSQLEEVLTRNPKHAETSINLARVRLTLNDPHGAEELLRNAVQNSPQDAITFFALADFYNITGNSAAAAEWYERGLRIHSDNPQALAAFGRLQAKSGHNQEADATFAQLAHNPDRRFRYAYATRLLESGRKTAALSEFGRIFKENPEDREARTHLIDAYLGSDQIPDAEELLAKAIAADSTDVDAHVQRAQIWLLRGNADAAEKDLNVALQYRRESAEAHYLMAQVHRNRQNEQLQVVELTEALRLNPGYSAARLELSRSLIGRNPQKALDVIDAAPEDQRQNPDLLVQRNWPLLELNRLEEARAAIGLLRSPENSEVLLQDAVLHMRQKDFAAGRELAQKALAANPADVRALELIMRCAVGQKQPAQGMEIIRRYAAQNRNLAAVQMFLGRMELQAGNAAQARSAFEAAKIADPGMLDAEWHLVDLDTVELKLEDARRRLASLLHGSSEAIATAKLALVEQTAGNYQAASQHYRRVLQLKPFDAGILNNFAYVLTEFMGNPSEALRYARTARELEPENAAVSHTLGWTYYRLGQYADAVRFLEFAAKRAPSARRHAHLAMAYAKYGDGVRAKQTLRAALKMDPDLPEASTAQKVVADSELPARSHLEAR